MTLSRFIIYKIGTQCIILSKDYTFIEIFCEKINIVNSSTEVILKRDLSTLVQAAFMPGEHFHYGTPSVSK
jgi:hypothetical protein